MDRQASSLRVDQVGSSAVALDGKDPAKDVDQDLRLNMPNMQAVNVNVAVSSSAGNASVLSNILTKVDIVIHYLQVYAMVLVLDVNIPYPEAFKDWSTWVRLSVLNLEDLWTFDLAYQQEALFGLVMAVPALLLGLYFYFDRLRGQQDDWADSYVTRWNMVKWRTFALYIFLVLGTTALSFFAIDGKATMGRLSNSEQPTPMSLTWALVFFGFLSFFYFVWFRVVRCFQRHWAQDTSDLKQEFKAKWLNLIHWAQIIFLFAITSIYLPVARVILIQFACDCVTSGADELCSSLLYSSETCFPSPVTRTQGVALVFVLLYIVLLPLFLIKLIREGIAIVMDLNTVYDNLGKDIEKLQKHIASIKAAKKTLVAGSTPEQHEAHKAKLAEFNKAIKADRETIALAKKRQEAEYFSRINDPIRKLASTSLYAAYEYEWRFWKIIQLVQNLLLVCISLFVPTSVGSIDQTRVFLGALAIAGSFLFVLWVRPYYSNVEDSMEIAAGFANTVTVAVALGLQYKLSWLTPSLSAVILLIANIAAVVAFVLAIVIVPCRIWRQNKKLAAGQKEAEQRMRELNAANKKKRASVANNPKAVHQAPATNGNKQAVEMASRV